MGRNSVQQKTNYKSAGIKNIQHETVNSLGAACKQTKIVIASFAICGKAEETANDEDNSNRKD